MPSLQAGAIIDRTCRGAPLSTWEVNMSKRYLLRVGAAASPFLAAAFPEFDVQPDGAGCSCLVGSLVDDAALHSALQRLQNLQVELLEVTKLE